MIDVEEAQSDDPRDWIAAAQAHYREADLPAAQAAATIAQALTLLQPTVEEVVAEYESVRSETTSDIVARLDRVRDILQDATRDGSRRHPAIYSALEVIRAQP